MERCKGCIYWEGRCVNPDHSPNGDADCQDYTEETTRVIVRPSVMAFVAVLFFATASHAQQSIPRCQEGSIYADGECHPCHVGDVTVKTSAQLEWLQNQVCVIGNVAVTGPGYTDSGKFTALDFGNLRVVRGWLLIHGLPFVQWLDAHPRLRVTGWLIITNCPWLPWCEARDFLDLFGIDGQRTRAGVLDGVCE